MSNEIINTNYKIKSKYLWHSSGIYCLTFDRTGNFIFTGGDDGVVKIYSISEDKLITTLSDGNESAFESEMETICKSIDNLEEAKDIEKKMEKFAIYDIAVNHENTLLAAGKHSGLIPIWDLQTGRLVVKLDRHAFPIASIVFSPLTVDINHKYLISTSEEGFIFFWKYNSDNYQFDCEPVFRRTKYDNCRAKNICSSFSSGGLLMAIIYNIDITSKSQPKKQTKRVIKNRMQSSIRVLSLSDNSGPKEVFKTTVVKNHNSCDYSLTFSHKSFSFASGCNNDPIVNIWSFDSMDQKWNKLVIHFNKKLTTTKGKQKKSLDTTGSVDEFVWSCDDNYLITNLSDKSTKVFNSKTGEVVQHFTNTHTKDIVIVDSHPTNDHIFMTGGYDGKILIYDILSGSVLKAFECGFRPDPDGQLMFSTGDDNKTPPNPMLHECRFSPNGLSFVATDSYGNMTLFALENSQEIDSIDRLEHILEQIHADSEETDTLVPNLVNSEKHMQSIKSKFNQELDILNGVEPKEELWTPTIEDNACVDSSSDSDMSVDNSVDKPKTIPKSPVVNKPKLMKGSKDRFKTIMNKIFDNPNSTPFQAVDHIEYPTYRKEISDADVHLSSIREDIVTQDRYSLSRFVKDMTLVFSNAKQFFKKRDKEIYRKALELEKFYNNEMEIMFGNSFKTSPKRHVNKSNNESDLKEDSDVCQTSTLSADCDDSEESDLLMTTGSKPVDSKTNKPKSPKEKSAKTIPKLKGSPISAKNELKRIQTDIEINSNQQIDESISNKKRKLSLTNEKVAKSTKQSLNGNSSKRIDVKDVSKTTSHEENGESDSSSARNTDNSSKLINLEPIDLEPIDRYVREYESEDEDEAQVEPKESISPLRSRQSLNNSNTNTHKASHLLNIRPYFCVFCDEIYYSQIEASNHYKLHLCPIKCLICDEKFASFYEFKDHNSEHTNNSENIQWTRNYSESIQWIKTFLEYQQSKDIERHSYQTTAHQRCIVCEKVRDYRDKKDSKKLLPNGVMTETHLKEHLKYEPQYTCLICVLENDELVSNSYNEAKVHIRGHLTNFKDEDFFSYFDASIPKLDEIIRKFYALCQKYV